MIQLGTWKTIVGSDGTYEVCTTGEMRRTKNGKTIKIHGAIDKGRRIVGYRNCKGTYTQEPVARVVWKAHVGPIGPGECIQHTGVKLDDNLISLRKRDKKEYDCERLAEYHRKTVLKVSPEGEVLDIYKSTVEAAKKNFFCDGNVVARYARFEKPDLFRNGFAFVYDSRKDIQKFEKITGVRIKY